MSTFVLGNYLTLKRQDGSIAFHFQNFYIESTSEWEGVPYSFVPFAFSGVTVTADGANVDASLVFPNNELTRDWGTVAAKEGWLAYVKVLFVDPAGGPVNELHSYTGQISGASWDETAMSLKASSVLDAVANDIPNRRLTRTLVGALPTTNAIQL